MCDEFRVGNALTEYSMENACVCVCGGSRCVSSGTFLLCVWQILARSERVVKPHRGRGWLPLARTAFVLCCGVVCGGVQVVMFLS